jgi:predicted nucleic-acid-binding protein
MIALDSNVLVRLAVEDDHDQAARARRLIMDAESRGEKVFLLSGVLLEMVWVLSRGYGYQRADIAHLLDVLLSSPTYEMENRTAVQRAAFRYRMEGDFADILFVELARDRMARAFFSFDGKLINLFPDYVQKI